MYDENIDGCTGGQVGVKTSSSSRSRREKVLAIRRRRESRGVATGRNIGPVHKCLVVVEGTYQKMLMGQKGNPEGACLLRRRLLAPAISDECIFNCDCTANARVSCLDFGCVCLLIMQISPA